MNIGIVGLGLIGGSLAKSIKEKTGEKHHEKILPYSKSLLRKLCSED